MSDETTNAAAVEDSSVPMEETTAAAENSSEPKEEVTTPVTPETPVLSEAEGEETTTPEASEEVATPEASEAPVEVATPEVAE